MKTVKHFVRRKHTENVCFLFYIFSTISSDIARPVTLPDKAKFTVCSIIKLATIAFDETSSYWSAPNSSYFSAFHTSPHGCLITTGKHSVTTRVVHLPKRTETSLITESDQSRDNHQLLQLCPVRTAWSESDQAVRAVLSCKSWFYS